MNLNDFDYSGISADEAINGRVSTLISSWHAVAKEAD